MDLSRDESEQWCGVRVLILSQVSAICEVMFSDSDCELVKPQTYSCFREHNASVALECETKMILERKRRLQPQGELHGPHRSDVAYHRHQKAHFCTFDRHGRPTKGTSS